MKNPSILRLLLQIQATLYCVPGLLAYDFEDAEAGFVNSADLEITKDLTSLITEVTVKSKCDGNVFVVSRECEDYIGLPLISLSLWAPPVTIVSYAGPSPFPDELKKLWTKFLAWDRRACSLIFVCDLVKPVIIEVVVDEGNFTLGEDAVEIENQLLESATEVTNPDHQLVFSSFPRFFAYSDQIIYLSYVEESDSTLSERSPNDFQIAETQTGILQQTGIMLWIGIRETSNTPEAVMDVFMKCEFCGPEAKLHQTLLGSYQRNRTQFGFFEQFEYFKKESSFNYSELAVGYFNHPPHFECIVHFFDGNVEQNCVGVEWEILSHLGKSLHINFTLSHLEEDQPRNNGKSAANISRMISALHEGKIDFAVGGISVTSERIALVDFSKVFVTEPIVFVVEKSNNIFILGIWLAFEPEVWPIILLIVAIISLLFRIIINRSSVSIRSSSLTDPKSLSLSFYMNRSLFSPKKPALVRMFEALEITLQPLLGQPLTSSQITTKPRRLLKLLLILWWFASLIITTLYSTSLISSLINPVRSREAESLQELIDFGYHFKLENNHGSVYELIASIPELPDTNSDEIFGPPVTNIPQTNLTDDQWKTIKLLRIIKERLVKDASSVKLIAYIMDESAVKSFNWTARNLSPNQLKIIRDRLFLNGYGFAMKPQASYKEKIDTALTRLSSAGLIDFWYSLFNHQEDKQVEGNKFRLRQKLSHVNLDLKILQGAFIFLVFGCTFSTIVFGMEHITKRYKFQYYSTLQVQRFLLKIKKHIVSFYGQHLAEQHPVVEINRIHEERFKKAAFKIVKLNSRNPFQYVK